MQAIILAAGFSTRLYPLTRTFPKALLKVNGSPIIDQIVKQIVTEPRITRTCLVTNNVYYPHFQRYLADNRLEKRIELVNDRSTSPENRLGAIGDLLWLLNNYRLNNNLLVAASDTLTSMNLEEFIDFFIQRKQSVTALYDVADPEIIRNKLGCATIDGRQQIVNFVEKPLEPPSHLACVPYYLFRKTDLSLIKEYADTGLSQDSPGSLLSYLHLKTPISAFIINSRGYYHDVGTQEVLTKLQRNDKIAP